MAESWRPSAGGMNSYPTPGQISAVQQQQQSRSTQGFFFKPRRERLDWRRLANLDIERIVRDIDVDELQSFLDNITYADISLDDARYFQDPSFVKLFRLSQLTIEYLLHAQDFLVQSRAGIEEEVQKLSSDLGKSTVAFEKKCEELRLSRAECKRLKRTLVSYEFLLGAHPELRKAVGGNINGGEEGHKCTICGKAYQTHDYLTAHFQRRHPGETVPPPPAPAAAPALQRPSGDQDDVLMSFGEMNSRALQSGNNNSNRPHSMNNNGTSAQQLGEAVAAAAEPVLGALRKQIHEETEKLAQLQRDFKSDLQLKMKDDILGAAQKMQVQEENLVKMQEQHLTVLQVELAKMQESIRKEIQASNSSVPVPISSSSSSAVVAVSSNSLLVDDSAAAAASPSSFLGSESTTAFRRMLEEQFSSLRQAQENREREMIANQKQQSETLSRIQQELDQRRTDLEKREAAVQLQSDQFESMKTQIESLKQSLLLSSSSSSSSAAGAAGSSTPSEAFIQKQEEAMQLRINEQKQELEKQREELRMREMAIAQREEEAARALLEARELQRDVIAKQEEHLNAIADRMNSSLKRQQIAMQKHLETATASLLAPVPMAKTPVDAEMEDADDGSDIFGKRNAYSQKSSNTGGGPVKQRQLAQQPQPIAESPVVPVINKEDQVEEIKSKGKKQQQQQPVEAAVEEQPAAQPLSARKSMEAKDKKGGLTPRLTPRAQQQQQEQPVEPEPEPEQEESPAPLIPKYTLDPATPYVKSIFNHPKPSVDTQKKTCEADVAEFFASQGIPKKLSQKEFDRRVLAMKKDRAKESKEAKVIRQSILAELDAALVEVLSLSSSKKPKKQVASQQADAEEAPAKSAAKSKAAEAMANVFASSLKDKQQKQSQAEQAATPAAAPSSKNPLISRVLASASAATSSPVASPVNQSSLARRSSGPTPSSVPTPQASQGRIASSVSASSGPQRQQQQPASIADNFDEDEDGSDFEDVDSLTPSDPASPASPPLSKNLSQRPSISSNVSSPTLSSRPSVIRQVVDDSFEDSRAISVVSPLSASDSRNDIQRFVSDEFEDLDEIESLKSGPISSSLTVSKSGTLRDSNMSVLSGHSDLMASEIRKVDDSMALSQDLSAFSKDLDINSLSSIASRQRPSGFSSSIASSTPSRSMASSNMTRPNSSFGSRPMTASSPVSSFDDELETLNLG